MRPPMDPARVFVVGAQRCGTTYLYRQLDRHPAIAMARPVRPEPKIFLSDAVTGDPQAYDARVFPDRPTARMRGEKSTSYLERPDALARLARTFPAAHVVVLVRDPVERALSNYRLTVEQGLEDRTADAALSADMEGRTRPYDRARISVSPYAYVRRGLYLPQLRRLESHVARARLHTVVFEELVADPAVVDKLYAALGVDALDGPAPPVTGAVVNPSSTPAALGPDTSARLRAFYAGPNAALARHLQRPLPWP